MKRYRIFFAIVLFFMGFNLYSITSLLPGADELAGWRPGGKPEPVAWAMWVPSGAARPSGAAAARQDAASSMAIHKSLPRARFPFATVHLPRSAGFILATP